MKYVVIVTELPKAPSGMATTSKLPRPRGQEIEVTATSRLDARRQASTLAYTWEWQGQSHSIEPENRPAHICEVYEA